MAQELLETKKALILTHENPDGDTIGSAGALFAAITESGGQAQICTTDQPQDFYDFLPGFSTIQKTTDDLAQQLVSEGYRIIIVDAPTPERVGLTKLPEGSKPLVIDHHPTREDYDLKACIESHASSTAELLYFIFLEAGYKLSMDVIASIFTGIVTDTGNFKYPNVTSDTMKVVMELIDKGLNISKYSALIYERMSFANRKLLGKAMERLNVSLDGKLATSAITWNDLTEYDAAHRDTDFIVDELRKLGGPEIYILAKEFKPDYFRISMRGRGKIDLNKVANTFGGGGHHDAAGFTTTGDWLYIRGALLELFEPLLLK
jgi:phosphoesterase RecJ-like protein